MPSIAEGVRANMRLNRGGQVARYAPASPGPTFSPPVINSAMGLPNRGTFAPAQIIGSDFYTGAGQFRVGQRSSTPPPPAASTTPRTPVALVNKRLVAPTIGGGTKLNRYNVVKTIISPVAVGGGATVTQLFTAAGVQAADKLLGYQWVAAQAKGVTVLAVRINAANQIAIDFFNPTGGSLTPTGGTILLFLVQ